MITQRIAYVVKNFPKLSETFILEELVELTRRGVEVHVCSLNAPQEPLHHRSVETFGLLDRATFGSDDFRAALNEFGPHLIHAHFATQPALAARTLAMNLGVPFTFTVHGYDLYRKPPRDFAERAAAASTVVTVSRANAEFMRDEFGVPMESIQVVPCGVDVRRFRPGTETCDPPLVLCVARMSPVKNLELLLRSCAILRQRQVRFRCVVIGDGRCRPKLEELRRTLGIESAVRFQGALAQEDVIGHWQRSAVGVLTSHSEGMPVSLMEAAACGVPVVATNVGGVAELVQDRSTGLVVPPNDATAFAAALESLLEDPERARRMGGAARQRAEELFSVKRQVDSLLSIWSSACSSRETV